MDWLLFWFIMLPLGVALWASAVFACHLVYSFIKDGWR